MKAARAALVFLGVSLVAGAAPAQPAADPNDAAAALFREGREALEKSDHVLACKKFTESLALSKRASTLLNLAQCEEGQRHLVAALQRWNEGIALLEAADNRLGPSKERAAALERRVPRLTVKLAPGAPAGTQITLDGSALDAAALGAAVAVDPGDHVLVVSAPGQLEQRSTITLAESERREVTLAPGLVPAAVATSSATATAALTPVVTPPPPAADLRTVGFVSAGIGLAGFIAFGVTGGVIAANDGTIKANCPDKRCNEQGFSALETSRSLFTVNAIGLGLGAAGVAAGALLIFVFGPPQAQARTVAVSAAVAPDSAGVRVTGAF